MSDLGTTPRRDEELEHGGPEWQAQHIAGLMSLWDRVHGEASTDAIRRQRSICARNDAAYHAFMGPPMPPKASMAFADRAKADDAKHEAEVSYAIFLFTQAIKQTIQSSEVVEFMQVFGGVLDLLPPKTSSMLRGFAVARYREFAKAEARGADRRKC